MKRDFVIYVCFLYYSNSATSISFTDTGYIDNLEFKDIDYFLIECNFDEEWFNKDVTACPTYFGLRAIIFSKLSSSLTLFSNSLYSSKESDLYNWVYHKYRILMTIHEFCRVVYRQCEEQARNRWNEN